MVAGDLELRVAWERHLGRSSAAGDAFATVLAHYREAHRRYHTERHLRWVIRHVTDLASTHPPTDEGAVVAAAFYHDVVYDPRAGDNEATSARVARRALGPLGWPDERLDLVDALVNGTATHPVETAAGPVSVDEAILYAADLAVLAAPPEQYGDYVRNVRREYHHVADDDWVVGRSAVLRSLLDRPLIFAPVLSLDAWEARARANITAELRQLAG